MKNSILAVVLSLISLISYAQESAWINVGEVDGIKYSVQDSTFDVGAVNGIINDGEAGVVGQVENTKTNIMEYNKFFLNTSSCSDKSGEIFVRNVNDILINKFTFALGGQSVSSKIADYICSNVDKLRANINSNPDYTYVAIIADQYLYLKKNSNKLIKKNGKSVATISAKTVDKRTNEAIDGAYSIPVEDCKNKQGNITATVGNESMNIVFGSVDVNKKQGYLVNKICSALKK